MSTAEKKGTTSPALYKVRFAVYLWQANDDLPPYGIIEFNDLNQAETFVIQLLEGCFNELPTIGINEFWIDEETGRTVKEIVKRTVKLGDEENDPVVISEEDQIIYDDLSDDPNMHQFKPKPVVTITLPFNNP